MTNVGLIITASVIVELVAIVMTIVNVLISIHQASVLQGDVLPHVLIQTKTFAEPDERDVLRVGVSNVITMLTVLDIQVLSIAFFTQQKLTYV